MSDSDSIAMRDVRGLLRDGSASTHRGTVANHKGKRRATAVRRFKRTPVERTLPQTQRQCEKQRAGGSLSELWSLNKAATSWEGEGWSKCIKVVSTAARLWWNSQLSTVAGPENRNSIIMIAIILLRRRRQTVGVVFAINLANQKSGNSQKVPHGMTRSPRCPFLNSTK